SEIGNYGGDDKDNKYGGYIVEDSKSKGISEKGNQSNDKETDSDNKGVTKTGDDKNDNNNDGKASDEPEDDCSNWSPTEGHQFESDKEAELIIKEWAISTGFRIRAGSSDRDGQKRAKFVSFLCSMEGFHKPDKNPDPKKQRNGVTNRCG
ncbi:hypothetical protein BGX26_008986, partial [Mortierella sp. AD094]